MGAKNPYSWNHDHLEHEVPRPALLASLVDLVQRGETGYVLGCRGMGKSQLLRRLQQEFAKRADLEPIALATLPRERTVLGTVQAIAAELIQATAKRGLGQEVVTALEAHAGKGRLREMLDEYVSAVPGLERLVLLYDDLDGYAPFGAPFFDELEIVRKNAHGRLVVFAAGGLGVAALDSLYGSSFFSRATPTFLDPFTREELTQLALPFEERGAVLTEDVIEALRLASGGNPLMATFGLQRLWDHEGPGEHHIPAIFAEFRTRHSMGFLDKIRDPIFASPLSNAPQLVFRELERASGFIRRERLMEVLGQATADPSVPSVKKLEWVLRMLRTSGLIRCRDGAHFQQDIAIEVIPSILTLEPFDSPQRVATLRERLIADLVGTLQQLHRLSADFRKARESVFSALLCVALELRGWNAVEREAQCAAGRTDIKTSHPDFADKSIVVEVKRWDNEDKDGIHAQVVSYWSAGVDALATVMVGEIKDPTWADSYERECLVGKTPSHRRQQEPPPAIEAQFVAASGHPGAPEVDHFLLRLAHR